MDNLILYSKSTSINEKVLCERVKTTVHTHFIAPGVWIVDGRDRAFSGKTTILKHTFENETDMVEFKLTHNTYNTMEEMKNEYNVR